MFERLLAQLDDLAIFAAVAMIFGIIKTVLRPQQRAVSSYFTVLVVSVPVGILAGALALEMGAGDYVSLAFASVGSLAAETICNLVLDNRALISRALENLVDKFTK